MMGWNMATANQKEIVRFIQKNLNEMKKHGYDDKRNKNQSYLKSIEKALKDAKDTMQNQMPFNKFIKNLCELKIGSDKNIKLITQEMIDSMLTEANPDNKKMITSFWEKSQQQLAGGGGAAAAFPVSSTVVLSTENTTFKGYVPGAHAGGGAAVAVNPHTSPPSTDDAINTTINTCIALCRKYMNRHPSEGDKKYEAVNTNIMSRLLNIQKMSGDKRTALNDFKSELKKTEGEIKETLDKLSKHRHPILKFFQELSEKLARLLPETKGVKFFKEVIDTLEKSSPEPGEKPKL